MCYGESYGRYAYQTEAGAGDIILKRSKHANECRYRLCMMTNLSGETPILASYRIPTKRSCLYLYQFLIETRQLNDQERPITAGMCWDPPDLSLSQDHPRLKQIVTRHGTTRYLLLTRTTPPKYSGRTFYLRNQYEEQHNYI